jgi:hypothetical protein
MNVVYNIATFEKELIMTTEQELKQFLAKDGFKFSTTEFNRSKWYAYRLTIYDLVTRPSDDGDTRPVQILVYFYEHENHGCTHYGVQVELCDPDHDDTWFNLQAYGMNIDDFMIKFQTLERKLVNAYTTIKVTQ